MEELDQWASELFDSRTRRNSKPAAFSSVLKPDSPGKPPQMRKFSVMLHRGLKNKHMATGLPKAESENEEQKEPSID